MKRIELMSRKLPYCDTKRSIYFKRLIFGLFLDSGKRDKLRTTYSYWFGYFFGEFNIKFTNHPN